MFSGCVPSVKIDTKQTAETTYIWRKRMKRSYEMPVMETVEMKAEDIIMASGETTFVPAEKTNE